MKTFDVVSVSLNLTPLDWTGNRQKIKESLLQVDSSLDNGLPKIICLPELCLSGPGCDDMFFSQATLDQSLETLRQLLAETDQKAVILGLPFAFEGKLYKSTVLIAGRKILGIHCSTFVEANEGHYDKRWFQSWPKQCVKETIVNGQSCPIGDIAFHWNGLTIGIDSEIFAGLLTPESNFLCETTNCSTDLYDLILCPKAVPFELGQQAKIRNILCQQSQKFDCPVVYSTLSGIEAGSFIYDGGLIIADHSYLLQNQRFSYQDVQFIAANFGIVENHRIKLTEQKPIFSTQNSSLTSFSDQKECDFVLETWETSKDILFEEFARAVSLGLYGYLKKSHSRGFVLSLSGGADSASIAVLICFMIKSGIYQLGTENFLKQFAYIPAVSDILKRLGSSLRVHETLSSSQENATSPKQTDEDQKTSWEPQNRVCSLNEFKEIVAAFLTTVYQATQNSSEITRRAASEIASFVGSKHYEFNIDPVVEMYKQIVSDQLGRKLDWRTDDLALQNIQARTRSPSAWLLANALGALLLSTGNRSEVACGYATMDGDTSGSLSPIAGIDKAFLRKWLQWLEIKGLTFPDSPDFYQTDFSQSSSGQVDSGSTNFWKVPALKFINDQQPTAELRPLETKQTDEADLMPYCVLDLFEKAIIRDKKDYLSVLNTVSEQLSQQGQLIEEKQLIQWQIRFYRLWSHSQWKRHRYAVGFHLDQYDLAPNSCCRFPIFSGDFQYEIESLQNRLKTLQ